MSRSSWLALFGLLAACGDEAPAPASFPHCGDEIPVEGEVCFKIERRALETRWPAIAILLPGDFDGDGKRDYYADDGGLGGDFQILVQGSTAFTPLYEATFDEEYLQRSVYRASARDIDLDGLTDLLTWMQYDTWAGHVLEPVFGGVIVRTRPGLQFQLGEKIFAGVEFGFDEPPSRFDGTFGDFDGDQQPDLFFARNLHLAYVLGPLSAPPALDTEYQLDLQEFGAQDNIVTVAVDLDDDGRDDVVLADGLGRVLTLYSDPNGILVPRTLTDTPVLPAMAGTLLAQDVDGDGVVDLVAGATRYKAGDLLPGEFAVARGTGDGGFEPLAAWATSVGPAHTFALWGSQVCFVHLALLDLDGSGYPALVYALRDEHTLVVHPQVGRTLGADPIVFPLDLEPAGVFADPQDDGSIDLLVSLRRDDNGTEDDDSDDRGPFIDRYRLDP